MIGAYLKRIRKHIGKDMIILPAARAVIENSQGEILFIERVDNGRLGLPAGGLEEGETIIECIIREVKEETGLDVVDPILIGIDSRPDLQTHTYPNGDCVQYFVTEFYIREWSGNLRVEDNLEIKDVSFKSYDSIDDLPELEKSTFESLRHFKKYGRPLIR